MTGPLGKVYIIFALFVTEYYTEKLWSMQLKKTNVQHSARTIYWVVYPWFLSVLEWLLTYRLVTTFFEIGVCPWPDLSSLLQYISPTPLVSLPLMSRIQFHPGIPVTLLTGSSWIIIANQIKWNDINWNTTLKLSFFFLLLVFFINFFSSANSCVCIFWFMVFLVEEAQFFQPWSSIISNGRKLSFMVPLSS